MFKEVAWFTNPSNILIDSEYVVKTVEIENEVKIISEKINW